MGGERAWDLTAMSYWLGAKAEDVFGALGTFPGLAQSCVGCVWGLCEGLCGVVIAVQGLTKMFLS